MKIAPFKLTNNIVRNFFNRCMMKIDGLSKTAYRIFFALTLLITNIALISYLYINFLNKLELASIKEAYKIDKIVFTKLNSIEVVLEYLKNLINAKEDITYYNSKFYQLSEQIYSAYSNNNNCEVYWYSANTKQVWNKYGKTENTLYQEADLLAKERPGQVVVYTIPPNYSYKGIILSLGVKNQKEQYIGSLHVMLTNLFFEEIIAEKLQADAEYILLTKNGELLTATDSELAQAYTANLNIFSGPYFFWQRKYVLPYEKAFFHKELKLVIGFRSSSLYSEFQKEVLFYLIILNGVFGFLCYLYNFLLKRCVKRLYFQLQENVDSLSSELVNAKSNISRLNSENSQLLNYIEVIKMQDLIIIQFIAELISESRTKSIDIKNVAILLQDSIRVGENTKVLLSPQKLIDLLDIILFKVKLPFVYDIKYSETELELQEVFEVVPRIFAKTLYENSININIKSLSNTKGIHLEKKSLEYILVTITGHLLKGLAKNTEINIEFKKTLFNTVESLEIKISDNGFGMPITSTSTLVSNSNYFPIGVLNLFLPRIEDIIQAIQIIGGSVVDNSKFRMGTVLVISIPVNRNKKENPNNNTEYASNIIPLFKQ